jgi:DNA primase
MRLTGSPGAGIDIPASFSPIHRRLAIAVEDHPVDWARVRRRHSRRESFDCLRNGEGATTVGPCQARQRWKAPVATPIAWE